MATRSDFELSFKLLIGHEGGFTDNRADRGNWTSGQIGVGELRGTKFGISAMSYPNLDIRNLTLQQAHDIYFRDFWTRSGGPDLPARTAFVVFDAAVNNGVSRAVRWLQEVVGSPADGIWGPNTRAASLRATERDETHVVVEFHSSRMRFMIGLNTWPTFGGGWSRRLVRVPLEAANYWPSVAPEAIPVPEVVTEPDSVIADILVRLAALESRG